MPNIHAVLGALRDAVATLIARHEDVWTTEQDGSDEDALAALAALGTAVREYERALTAVVRLDAATRALPRPPCRRLDGEPVAPGLAYRVDKQGETLYAYRVEAKGDGLEVVTGLGPLHLILGLHANAPPATLALAPLCGMPVARGDWIMACSKPWGHAGPCALTTIVYRRCGAGRVVDRRMERCVGPADHEGDHVYRAEEEVPDA